MSEHGVELSARSFVIILPLQTERRHKGPRVPRKVVISRRSFNPRRVENFEISFTSAEIESNGIINARCAGVTRPLQKAISEAAVRFCRDPDEISVGEEPPNPLHAYYTKNPLKKNDDEFPQGEFLFMLKHGEHISAAS